MTIVSQNIHRDKIYLKHSFYFLEFNERCKRGKAIYVGEGVCLFTGTAARQSMWDIWYFITLIAFITKNNYLYKQCNNCYVLVTALQYMY